jgi:hypothetical protein
MGSLRDQLRNSEQSSAANGNIAHSAEHALTVKQSELAALASKPKLSR